MPKEKIKTFEEKVTDILADKLKFYLTEFGQRDDLKEIAQEISKLCQNYDKKVSEDRKIL